MSTSQFTEHLLIISLQLKVFVGKHFLTCITMLHGVILNQYCLKLPPPFLIPGWVFLLE
jgi:hypothetical protein